MLTLSRRKAARDKIQNHDLRVALDHARKYFQLEDRHEHQALAEYRHFMYLAYWKRRIGAKFSVVPTMYGDKIWHGHLLDTIDYRRFCARVVGEFIDHHPAGRRTREEQLHATGQTKLLHEEYGGDGFCPDYLGKVRIKRSDDRKTSESDDDGFLVIHLVTPDSDSGDSGCGD